MMLRFILFLCMAMCLNVNSDGAKILIYPMDCGFNSRLMNLVKIGDILNANGHNASVLVNNRVASMLKPDGANLIIYEVPNVENLQFLTDQEVLDKIKDFKITDISNFLENWIQLVMPFCQSVLGTRVLQDLKAEGFDLVITDNIWDCGKMLIEYFNVPSLTYSNWGFTLDPNVFYPALPSFVCTAGSPEVCSSDKMNFKQRMANFLQFVVLNAYITPKVTSIYDRELRQKYNLNKTTPFQKYLAIRSPVIVNGDFVLDYPRPTMPHILMVPGLFHKKPKPLPGDIEVFINQSAPHGIVVVSFGSMVSKVDEEKAEIFAKVLGELPQRVIWRHMGKKPKHLMNNTKLVSWFPQADVLGHPFTKMFVTHCGISGTYEAAMNGLPVVAIPMFADQEYNSKKLVERGGMGIHVNLDTMTEIIFRDAVTEVMSNSTYLKNAQRVSALLKDEEMPAKEKLLYWVNYVIRHNGARHLISETALSMSNFVFYSVDVILVLIIFIFLIVSITAILSFCCLRVLCKCVQTNEKYKKL